MLKLINYFGSVLCAMLLCSGLMFVGCTDDPLGSGPNTEQGENDNGQGGGAEGGDDVGNDNEQGGGVDGEAGNEGAGETNDAITNTSGGVTLTVMLRNLTEIGVDFYGEAVLSENYTASSFGILYSEEEIFTASTALSLPIVDIYGTNYSVSTTSLKPATIYYYTSYIKQGDLYKYGEIKSFTTASLVAPSLNDAVDVTEVSATISGTVCLATGTASDLEYGFQYSKSESFSSDVTTKKITDLDSENKFSMSISSLTLETAYYYRSYIKMNGVYCYGEVKSFTTVSLVAPSFNDVVDVTEVSAKISGTVNLAAGTAPDLEYGFQYSESESFSSGVTTMMITDLDFENKFRDRKSVV